MSIQKKTPILISRKELVILAVLLAVSMLSYLIFSMQAKGAKVEIRIARQIFGTYDINQEQVVEVRDSDGTFLLRCEIRNGTVKVTESRCKDKICLDEGFISKNSQTIICLPQQVVISVVNEDQAIDGVLK